MRIRSELLLLAFLFLLLSPTGDTCLIKSEMEIKVDNIPPISPIDYVEINATLVYKWDIGAFHVPVFIEIEKENLPKWLSVSISPQVFTITTDKFTGGEKRIPFKMILYPKEEVKAFSKANFTVYAKAKAIIPIIRNCETEKRVEVMQDFFNGKRLNLTIPHEIIGDGTYELIIENNCNGDVMVELNFQDLNDWDVIFNKTKFVVPSKFSMENRKTIKMKIKEGKSNSVGRIEMIYYPIGKSGEKERMYMNVYLYKEKNEFYYLIAPIVLIALIIFLFYRYKK